VSDCVYAGTAYTTLILGVCVCVVCVVCVRVYICVCVWLCVYVRDCVCVSAQARLERLLSLGVLCVCGMCVCVCERERERECVSVSVSVCVCVCEWTGERGRELPDSRHPPVQRGHGDCCSTSVDSEAG